MKSVVSIHAKYKFPSKDQEAPVVIEKKFDEGNCQIARLGLPDGVEAVKPQGGDYSYSGMHDHGPLPLPKEGGEFAKLIGMVNEARKHSDAILTKLIEEENNENAAAKDRQRKSHKKKRISGEDEKNLESMEDKGENEEGKKEEKRQKTDEC